MNVPLLDLKAQYAPIREEVRKVMDEVCDAQYFILGPKVELFESHVADYCGVRHAVGASSGTDALLMAMMALDIGAGDAVITSTYTFFATAGSIARLGATPIFVDIDPESFNIDPEQVRAVLTNPPENVKGLNIKAIMPVHLYGQMADMDALMDIASEFGVAVIEDAAQAIGAEYPAKDGIKRAGSMSDMGCFSFFPSKNLGGFGDGGMVVTNDDALADKLRKLRNHGMAPKYYHKFVGGNFRLDALQAVVLDVKLKYLDEWHAARRDNASVYNKAFAGSSVRTPATIYADTAATNYHIYNQYIIRAEERDAVRDRLLANDIGCDIYYPVPMHMQECFSDLGYQVGDLPISEQAAKETLALPIYPELTDEMQEYVAGVVKAER